MYAYVNIIINVCSFFFLFVILPGRLPILPTHCLLIAHSLPTLCEFPLSNRCLQCSQVLLTYRPLLRRQDVRSTTPGAGGGFSRSFHGTLSSVLITFDFSFLPGTREGAVFLFFFLSFHVTLSSMFNCISYFL